MRRVALVLGAALGLATLFSAAPLLTVAATGQEGPSVGGRLTGPDDTPVPGVTITVARDGRRVGDDTSGADGTWRVVLPEAGTYEVTIDTEDIPDGLVLRSPERATLDNVIVRGGQQTVLFPLVATDAEGVGGRRFARIADLAVDGLRIGAIIALAALGLSLIFGVTGLVNFAHGELVAFGALVAWYGQSSGHLGLPLIAGAVLAVVLGGGLGAGLELGLWRPLRRRQTGNIALLVVSIGLSLLLRHLFLAVFSGRPRPYSAYAVQSQFAIGPIDLVPKDAVIIVVALVVLAVVGVLFKVTRLGTAMRAVADDRDLAESSGIDVSRIILSTWIAGSALAAMGGVFYGTTENVSWNMGGILLLPMFAAVILGGLGTAYGAMVGGLVMGVASEVSTYWIPVEFKVVFSLCVLILVLLVRPQGIFGVRERIG